MTNIDASFGTEEPSFHAAEPVTEQGTASSEFVSPYRYAFDPDDESTAARALRLVGADCRVLELGCAYGVMTRVLAEHYHCRVTGLEIDAASAEQARAYCERLIVADLDQLDWPATFGDETFDAVVAADVLEHLRDPGRCLREIRQRLRPGGRLVVSVPNVAFQGVIASLLTGELRYADTGILDRTHLRFFTWRSMERALNEAGFGVTVREEVRASGEHPEFAEYWAHLPATVARSIEALGSVNVYQYVLLAEPMAEPVALTVSDDVLYSDWSNKLLAEKIAQEELIEREYAQANRLSEQDIQLKEKNLQLATLTSTIGALQNSASWRITKPLRKLSTLPRRLMPFGMSFRLQPASQINTGASSGTYISTGDDPYFLLKPGILRSIPGGSCIVRYRASAVAPLFPQLYVDDGAGFREELCFSLGVCHGDTVTLRLDLPANIRALRLDPLSAPGAFTFELFEITHVASVWTLLPVLWKKVQEGLCQPATLNSRFAKLLRIIRRGGFTGLQEHLLKLRLETDNHRYADWVRNSDTLSEDDRKAMVDNTAVWPVKPLISVLMPVYNPPLQLLDKAIASVRNQVYPNWQLCIADDASSDGGVRALLQKHAAADDRIKVTYREVNGHISHASNSALALATGNYIALLDHDDELAEHALYWVAEAINRHPEAGLIYSDEDKMDVSGVRSDPYFKCDWNYDLFLSQNMISHLGIYKTTLLRDIGGFRAGFEGAQDYDLALRCIERLNPAQIVHIPRILYHWRIIPGSTALGGGEKPYAVMAAKKAVGEHLQRMSVAAEVLDAPHAPGMQRVRYQVPDPAPSVLIVIPTRDRVELLRVCVDSILEHSSYSNYQICIVDNGSIEESTQQYLVNLPKDKVFVLRDDDVFNFSRLNNKAVISSRHDFICLLNNDMEVITPDWLEEMVGHAIQPGVGAVGARLWYPDGRLQHGGVVLGIGGVAGHSHKCLNKWETGYFCRAVLQQSYSAVTAACLLIRREIYNEMNGLDEVLQVAFNDVDFCIRVREAGYRNVWTPYAEFFHYESASRGHETSPEKQARFTSEVRYMQERWGGLLELDPYYSPNLTLEHEDFSIVQLSRLELL